MHEPFHVTRPVGTGHSRANDVIRIRKALTETGHGFSPPEPSGVYDPSVQESIQRFQRDFGLHPDAVIKPGGPTERAIRLVLDAKRTDERRGEFETTTEDRGEFRNAGAPERPAARAREDNSLGSGPFSADEAVLNPNTKPVPKTDRLGSRGEDRRLQSAGRANLPASKPSEKAAPALPQRADNLPAFLGAKQIRSVPGPDQPEKHKQVLDRVEQTFREYVKAGRRKGLNQAAGNLERFLNGSGKPRTFTRVQARAFRPIRDAELFNMDRYEDESFLAKTGNTSHNDSLKRLKDGQSVLTTDHWEREYGPFRSIGRAATGDLDFFVAFGRTELKSKSAVTATRKGDTIHFDGTVTHAWDDRYNFEPMQPGGGGALALQEFRGAKPFKFGAKWTQRVKGTVRVHNGKLSDPKFKWQDVND